MGVNFEYGKTLACEGSIMLVLGLVPYVGWVLGIIGIFLLMRGIKEISSFYQDDQIYHNALTGIKYYIIALIAAAVAVPAIIISVATYYPISGFTGFGMAGLAVGIAIAVISLAVAFVFYILAAKHLRKTFNSLAQKSGEHYFRLAGTLLWWGSLLTIIFIGLLLIILAWIFATIAFFLMKFKQPPYPPAASTYTPAPSSTAVPSAPPPRYCSYCGAQVKPDAVYCPQCGRQL